MKFFQDCGFNILVHGVGSKRNILNDYLRDKLYQNGHDVTVVNGYHSGTGMKNVLASCFEFLAMTNSAVEMNAASFKERNIRFQFKFVLRKFQAEKEYERVLYFVIHSLDKG